MKKFVHLALGQRTIIKVTDVRLLRAAHFISIVWQIVSCTAWGVFLRNISQMPWGQLRNWETLCQRMKINLISSNWKTQKIKACEKLKVYFRMIEDFNGSWWAAKIWIILDQSFIVESFRRIISLVTLKIWFPKPQLTLWGSFSSHKIG